MSLGFRQPGNSWGEVSITPSEMTKGLPGKGLCFPTTRLPGTSPFGAMTGAVSWKRWLWALPTSEQASAITPSWLNLFHHPPLTQWPNSFWSKSQPSYHFIHKYPILSLKDKDSFPGNYTTLITPKLCAIITANIIKYLSVLTFPRVSHLNQDANKVHTLWLFVCLWLCLEVIWNSSLCSITHSMHRFICFILLAGFMNLLKIFILFMVPRSSIQNKVI